MSTILTFLLLGAICIIYNEPISKELARLYLYPFKWLFGERQGIIKTQEYFLVWMRFTLYAGALISLLIIISEAGYIFGI